MTSDYKRLLALLCAGTALSLPLAAHAQSIAYGDVSGSGAKVSSDRGSDSADEDDGEGDVSAPRRSGGKKVKVTPYIEAQQVVFAELEPGNDVLTYSSVQAGIDATVDAFRKAGFNVVLTEKFKTGSGNFGPLVSKAKAARPDILYWVGYDTDALPLATEIRQQNLQLGLLYGTPPSWPVGFEKNNLSDNVAGLSLWLSSSPNKDSRTFVAAYRKKYGTVTDEYFAPLAYVNLKTLAAAINAAGTTDKAKVAAEMAKTNVSTPFGQLTFSPSLKTKYQGFKAGNWLHFQYLGDARVPVFPIKFAQKPMVYGK